MINLDAKCLDEVKAILRKCVPDCEVRVYGSRLHKTARIYSDLDLAIVGKEPLDRLTIEALKDSFSESDLPIMADILDWHEISDEFRKIIERNYEVIQKGPNGC